MSSRGLRDHARRAALSSAPRLHLAHKRLEPRDQTVVPRGHSDHERPEHHRRADDVLDRGEARIRGPKTTKHRSRTSFVMARGSLRFFVLTMVTSAGTGV